MEPRRKFSLNFKAQSKFSPVALQALQARIVPKLVAAVTEGCSAVVDEAQAICPVDTGELVSSIHTASVELVGTSVQGVVAADAPHAGFVEFGTGVRGEGTYPYDLPETGVPFSSSWVYDYKQQGWIGHAAQPFLRPAIDSARSAILDAYQKQGFTVR